MKRQSKKNEQPVDSFPVWTFEQAERAIPYISSVLRSIRERYVETQGQLRLARKLGEKPGRPDRTTIIQHEEAKREADRLQDQVADAAAELAQLNIHCIDPVNGIAMIPFVKGEELAWMVFDLFDEVKITAWRFHEDPLTERRPLDEIDQLKPAPAALIV